MLHLKGAQLHNFARNQLDVLDSTGPYGVVVCSISSHKEFLCEDQLNIVSGQVWLGCIMCLPYFDLQMNQTLMLK